MARHRLLVAVLLTLAFVQSGRSQSGVTRVWAVDDGEKVRRDDLSHWAGASADNAVWDGRTIRLFGARNEIVAFQLQLEARGSGAMDVNVALDSLAGPGYLIANRSTNDDPFDYRGRHIELFLEQYINVTQRSMSGGIATWGDARPLPDAEHLGWIPDALVPFQATPGTADWVGGAPFAIGPGRNQGVWIDITIPRDAPPGTYRATVRVSEQGRRPSPSRWSSRSTASPCPTPPTFTTPSTSRTSSSPGIPASRSGRPPTGRCSRSTCTWPTATAWTSPTAAGPSTSSTPT